MSEKYTDEAIQLAGSFLNKLIKNDGWVEASKERELSTEFRNNWSAENVMDNFASALGLEIVYGTQGVLAVPKQQGSIFGYMRGNGLQQALGRDTNIRDCLNTKQLILLYFLIYMDDEEDDRAVITNFMEFFENELRDQHEKYPDNQDLTDIYDYYNSLGGSELAVNSRKTKRTKEFLYEDVFKFLQNHHLIEDHKETDDSVFRTAKMLELSKAIENGHLGGELKNQLEEVLDAQTQSI